MSPEMSPQRTRALFTALAAEFASMADGVEGLAALMSELMRTADTATRPQALQQAQAIDALVQRCLALRDVSEGLGDGRALETVLAEAPLADLAVRLGGSVHTPSDRSSDPMGAGDLLLFD